MNQRKSESIGMPRAVARRTVRRPQLGVERLESRAMLTSYYVPEWDSAWPESWPVEADELNITAPVEDVAWDEAVEFVPGPEVPCVEDDAREFAAPADDGTDDESITEPVSEPQSEGDGGTPMKVVEPLHWLCDVKEIVGHIWYDLGLSLEGVGRLNFMHLLYEGDDVDAAVADVLSDLRSGINGPVVTKVFVSIPDGQGGQLEYELDYSKFGEPESTVGDTPAEAPPVTEPDPIGSFDTDTAATESETDWTETDTDWVEPETPLAEPDNVEDECVPELPAHDLTESFRQELLRNSLAFAPMSVVVRPTVVRFDALSMRSPAAAYFAALAGLPSQVSEAASVTAVGAKRRGR